LDETDKSGVLEVHALRQAADIVTNLIVTDGPPVNDTLSITSE
jgi:hypothetical protein